MGSRFLIGLDFGTDSVRAIVVDAENGKEVGGSVSNYRRWAQGSYCEPSKNQFRQHPLDYLEGMEAAIKGALEECSQDVRDNIVGIGVDTTGSTPCAVNGEGIPLALLEEFSDNPNAMFILWKDHTAIKEAEEINRTAKEWGGVDYTKYEGGVYSSEWFWSKIIHTIRVDEKVRQAAYSWVEHCDWMTGVLTGNTDPHTMKRSRCAAGHKAMWHEDWGGLPDEEFLLGIEPLLKGLKNRLFKETSTSDQSAGGLTKEWAEKLGLKAGIPVAVGALDAHMGAVGGEVKDKALLKIMGTSTCDIMVVPKDVIGGRTIRGISGQVDGSVIPGMIGLEAGQSAYGDVYAWFREFLLWPVKSILSDMDGIDDRAKSEIADKMKNQILVKLTEEARRFSNSETGLLALDWLNGRRTPFADQTLKGAVIGLALGTTAPKIFKALVEATAFGAKAIIDQFVNEGVEIEEVIALGGIAKKNDFVMQVTSDILNKPIKVVASDQACALGSAMFAAVVAGIYKDIGEAQAKMGQGFSDIYYPRAENVAEYQRLYESYLALGQELEGYLKDL